MRERKDKRCIDNMISRAFPCFELGRRKRKKCGHVSGVVLFLLIHARGQNLPTVASFSADCRVVVLAISSFGFETESV